MEMRCSLTYAIIASVCCVVQLQSKGAVDGENTKIYTVDTIDLHIVIRNMPYKLSKRKAVNIKTDLRKQANVLGMGPVRVKMLHEEWAPENGWTVLPLFKHLLTTYGQSTKWFFFCEDTTEINLKGLLEVLSRFDYNKNYFLGHELYDEEISIIHHFAFHPNPSSFKFPDFDAGWALSVALLRNIVERLTANPPDVNFSIDVKHELARFIFNDDKGDRLTNVPEFCINKPLNENTCVSTVNHAVPECGTVNADDILIAVKTCEKFHGDRVPVVKKTVAANAKNIRYYSDIVDESIPTEYIGVNNTERGHCQKLHNIIKKFTDKEWSHIPWLVVIDDDTIMNFNRLQKLLACYDPKEPILMGERYGYGLNFNYHGYEYPTGGGGMVLSRVAVEKLLENKCHCDAPDSPDDMWLGMCFRRMGVPIVHTNSFHQARPSQYSKEFLSHRYLVSFHKHFMVDPLQIYRDYLEDEPIKKEE